MTVCAIFRTYLTHCTSIRFMRLCQVVVARLLHAVGVRSLISEPVFIKWHKRLHHTVCSNEFIGSGSGRLGGAGGGSGRLGGSCIQIAAVSGGSCIYRGFPISREFPIACELR